MAPHHPLDQDDGENPLRMMAGAVGVEPLEVVERRRPEIVALLEREIADAPVRLRRRRRAIAATLAAGAIAAGVTLFFTLARPRPNEFAVRTPIADGEALVVLAEGEPHTSQRPSTTLHSGESIRSGETLLTGPASELHLELGGKTNVELGRSSSLELEKAEIRDQQFFLRRGRASFDVGHPKGLGARLVRVDTPEARVTVRGTRFGVEVLSNPEAHLEYTHVWVERGSVSVESNGRSVLLGPGQDWRSDAETPTGKTPASSPPQPKESETPATAPLAAAKSSRSGAREVAARAEPNGRELPPIQASTLREQNEFFEAALSLARSGKKAESRAKLELFLERYPSSPLRAAAVAELRRQEKAE